MEKRYIVTVTEEAPDTSHVPKPWSSQCLKCGGGEVEIMNGLAKCLSCGNLASWKMWLGESGVHYGDDNTED
jgi:hypothetical protein